MVLRKTSTAPRIFVLGMHRIGPSPQLYSALADTIVFFNLLWKSHFVILPSTALMEAGVETDTEMLYGPR